ncbi:hypothetical protein ABB55_03185 [Prosthecomicrobium hirschii]|uniref:ATP synthase subunit E n=2 Tax=Prosthecodimorpha hirschii TaxID=665126 RepID=A0A0P6VZV4_9HYPH|nr:formate dehydrogenase subunit gamma [Prosthecomicrobium hirschii]KPL51351.1 hypothetical protein ABB55_03185 [Prosthecomicrobium hirschii]
MHRGQVSGWDPAVASRIIEARRQEPGAMLPILHELQETFGYVDRAALPLIADALNLSRAEVHGVVSFYHDFRSEPAGRTQVKICRGEACQAVGCRELVATAERRHGLTLGETSPAGDLTLEEVFCLGNCALGPAVQVDGELHGRVTPDVLDALIAMSRSRGHA